MATAMEVETEAAAAPSLLMGLSNELFWEVLSFLGALDMATLSRTNRLFRDPAHPIWFAVALSLSGKKISHDNKTSDSDVNWKNAVALSLSSKMPSMKFKDVLSNHIVAWRGTAAESHTHFKSTTSWKPELYIPAAAMHLTIPLDPIQLRQLIDGGYCEQAPMGRGTETIVDLETRKCKRLMLGTDVLIGDLEGNGFPACTSLVTDSMLHQIQEKMVPHLFAGGGRVWAQPYSMLIYEAGDFFKPHRDTLRGKHHFGSLTFQLPVQGGCTGGEFILTHGSSSDGGVVQQVASIAPPGGEDHVRYLAFFTDMFHHVQPVVSGFRVSLTFHLWAVPPDSGRAMTIPPGVGSSTSYILLALLKDGLQRHFRYWENGHRFVFPLDHKYRYNVSPSHLRGRDFVFHGLLKDCIESASLEFSLETICVEGFKKPDDPTKYKRLSLVQVDDELEKADTEVASKQTVWLNQERFLAMHHTFELYQYDTGNEGYTADYQYEHACIVISTKGFELAED